MAYKDPLMFNAGLAMVMGADPGSVMMKVPALRAAQQQQAQQAAYQAKMMTIKQQELDQRARLNAASIALKRAQMETQAQTLKNSRTEAANVQSDRNQQANLIKAATQIKSQFGQLPTVPGQAGPNPVYAPDPTGYTQNPIGRAPMPTPGSENLGPIQQRMAQFSTPVRQAIADNPQAAMLQPGMKKMMENVLAPTAKTIPSSNFKNFVDPKSGNRVTIDVNSPQGRKNAYQLTQSGYTLDTTQVRKEIPAGKPLVGVATARERQVKLNEKLNRSRDDLERMQSAMALLTDPSVQTGPLSPAMYSANNVLQQLTGISLIDGTDKAKTLEKLQKEGVFRKADSYGMLGKNFSDKEGEMFKDMLLGLQDSPDTIAQFYAIQNLQRDYLQKKFSFIENYAAKNKGNYSGAEKAWDTQIKLNPAIFKDTFSKENIDRVKQSIKMKPQPDLVTQFSAATKTNKITKPPEVGAVQGGYVFMGGDPSSPESWKKTQ